MRNTCNDNENEPLTFIQLGLQTALLLNRIKNAQTLLELAKDQKEEEDRETDRDRTDEQRAKDHRAYIERYLRDIAAFERRARGEKY